MIPTLPNRCPRLKDYTVMHRRLLKRKATKIGKKGNKAVLEAAEDASAAVERKDLVKAKEALDIGMSLVKERQKMILLADNRLGGKPS